MVIGWFKKLKNGLSKSSEKISGGITKILKSKKISDLTLNELEELLISSDLGVIFSEKIIEELKRKKLVDPSVEKVKEIIQKKIDGILKPFEKSLEVNEKPFVILIVGVNGCGKTATVGKIADKLSKQKKKVGLVAADTFRAAASQQLKIWADRTGSQFFSAAESSDPAALAFSAINEGIKNKLDVVLIDTAGRLHNKTDLMNELSKIIRVIKKINPNYPNETILVLDGNTGQNSLKQAEVFKEVCNIDGLVITKLDGTAKGGVLIPIVDNLSIPIIGIGVGEKKEDLLDFNAKDFSKALLDIKF